MPDLQTALSKVIASWDNTPEAKVPQPQESQMETQSISERVFAYVKANPGMTPNQYGLQLNGQFKYHTVRALVNQMVRAGMFARDASGNVIAVAGSYAPIKYNRTKKFKRVWKGESYLTPTKQPAPEVRTQTILEQAKQAVTAHQPQPNASPAIMLPSVRELTADYVMQTISIAEGKKLFTLLSQVF